MAGITSQRKYLSTVDRGVDRWGPMNRYGRCGDGELGEQKPKSSKISDTLPSHDGLPEGIRFQMFGNMSVCLSFKIHQTSSNHCLSVFHPMTVGR